MLVRHHVMPFLHQFVEYAFLREVYSDGYLLITHINNLTDVVQCVFINQALFAHTLVILIHHPLTSEATSLCEYVYSN